MLRKEVLCSVTPRKTCPMIWYDTTGVSKYSLTNTIRWSPLGVTDSVQPTLTRAFLPMVTSTIMYISMCLSLMPSSQGTEDEKSRPASMPQSEMVNITNILKKCIWKLVISFLEIVCSGIPQTSTLLFSIPIVLLAVSRPLEIAPRIFSKSSTPTHSSQVQPPHSVQSTAIQSGKLAWSLGIGSWSGRSLIVSVQLVFVNLDRT